MSDADSTNQNPPDAEEVRADRHLADAIIPLIRRKKSQGPPRGAEPAPSQQEMEHLLRAANEASVTPNELISRLSRVVEELDQLPEEPAP